MPKKLSPTVRGKMLGYRSGLEEKVADHMTALGWDWVYEDPVQCCFNYTKTVYKGALETNKQIHPPPRGSKVVQVCRYTVDFCVTRPDGSKWYIETKGYFPPADRAKHKRILEQYPNTDIRILFENNLPLSKGNRMRYRDWCNDHNIRCGFVYIDTTTKIKHYIPEEWL